MLCMFLLCFMVVNDVQAEEKIVPSTKNYDLTYYDDAIVYIGNKNPVKWKEGEVYFLHYTVEQVSENETTQSGVIVTADNTDTYPFLKGAMYFDNEALICEEGYTYFFRFEVTKTGFKYIAAKAKDEQSEYFSFSQVTGEVKTKGPYFGIWMAEGGNLSAKLKDVRCYDKNGTDLGIYAPTASSVTEADLKPLKGIDHTYAFSMDKAQCVAFGNARRTASDVIFLEYTINNVVAEGISQSGTIANDAPTAQYPHGDDMGLLFYQENNEKQRCMLITEGASYLVRFQRLEHTYDVFVKRTQTNGKTDYFSFSAPGGVYNKEFSYVSMWIGEMCSLTADFSNVKCYDGKGNNLAIQTNQGVVVQHFGNLEDYSQCEAVYYCKENNTFISLDDGCNASKRLGAEEVAKAGTYSIREGIMTLKIGDEIEEFDYTYNAFVSKDDSRYVRLKDTEVTFYSKHIDGKVIETVKVTAKNGFKVSKPSEPSEKGFKFLRWETGDNQEYEFNQVVLETTDLFAAWEGEQEWILTSMLGANSKLATTIAVSITCVTLLAGTATYIILKNVRRKKNGSTKKETDK